jgi:ATP-dependent RNA helicase SUPV3L1/SUV3
MIEGEATQEPAAPEDAPALPSSESPVETHDAPPTQPEDAGDAPASTPSEELVATEDTPPEAAAEPTEDAPREAPPDWGHLRGLQSVEAPAEEVTARADYADQLTKELAARATRFANSVDESIVLSSDGLMRWLGDPIARVVAGETLLAPRAVLLADEALAGEDRARAENRAALWLTAHIRKLLGPLIALVEGADLPEAARTVGLKIAEALGVLERDRVRAEVKTLDQTARGALRKLGVRFGSQYIYAPILLKPAARGLCSLLWTLRRGAEPGADRLLAFASAGRTSFANEGLLSPDAYRVAGFRLSGERVVRVDIIERLSDLIRAAIPDHMRMGSRAASEAYGFLITPQMTSLTGCSGEAFASILRSLGFEPIKVSKAAFEAANRRAPTEPIRPAVAQQSGAAPEAAEGESDGGEKTPQVEAAEIAASVELADAEGSAETAAATAEGDNEVPHSENGEDAIAAAPEVAVASEEVELADEPSSPLAEVEPHIDASDDAPEAVAAARLDEVPTAEAEALGEPAAGAAESAPSAEGLDAREAAAPPASGAEEAPASSEVTPPVAPDVDEEIEIWRPAPRRPRAPPRPHGAREASAHPGKGRDQRRHSRPEARAPAEAAGASPAAEAPPSPQTPARGGGQHRRDEEARRRDGRGAEDARPPREERRPNRDFGPRREPRPVQVDPDSPFAKLAALKPLLERRDKRT